MEEKQDKKQKRFDLSDDEVLGELFFLLIWVYLYLIDSSPGPTITQAKQCVVSNPAAVVWLAWCS